VTGRGGLYSGRAGGSWQSVARGGEWSLVVSLMLPFIPVSMGGGRPPRHWWKGPPSAWRVAHLGAVRAGRPWLTSVVASPTRMADLSATVAAGGVMEQS
jgi:hypothetical protein